MTPCIGIILVTASFALLIGALKLLRQKVELHPEVSRKLVHVCMGLVTLSFPFLFRDVWPVWFLCGSIALILAGFRYFAPIQKRFGGILGGVERRSWGEFYFPLAVAVVFTVAHQKPALYIVPILVLTLADAVAAIVGIRFGRLKYRTDDGWKSIEGSLALFFIATLSTAVTGLLGSGAHPARIAATAVCVGVLAALVEAIAWQGLDNLFLPLATLAMIIEFAGHTTAQLVSRLSVALGLLLLLFLWRHHTTLRDNALAGATLVLYLCFTVGGWVWLEPPLVLAMAYTFLPFRPQHVSPAVHGNSVMLSMAAAGFFWLFLDKGLHTAECRVPFVLSFAAQLSMGFLARWKRGRPATATWIITTTGALAAWLFVAAPALLLGRTHVSLTAAAVSLFVVGITTAVFCAVEGHPEDMPNTPRRWLLQTSFAFLGSMAGSLPVFKT